MTFSLGLCSRRLSAWVPWAPGIAPPEVRLEQLRFEAPTLRSLFGDDATLGDVATELRTMPDLPQAPVDLLAAVEMYDLYFACQDVADATGAPFADLADLADRIAVWRALAPGSATRWSPGWSSADPGLGCHRPRLTRRSCRTTSTASSSTPADHLAGLSAVLTGLRRRGVVRAGSDEPIAVYCGLAYLRSVNRTAKRPRAGVRIAWVTGTSRTVSRSSPKRIIRNRARSAWCKARSGAVLSRS